MPKTDLSCRTGVRIFASEKCFGPGIAELLERVDRLHSLRRATMEMGMAYSKAWKILRTAERELGFSLLDAKTGGRGGGGAELTDEARDFLVRFRRLESEVAAYADKAFQKIYSED